LLKCFVGTGILYLPKGFRNGGWLFSIIALLVSACLTMVSITKLLAVRSEIGGGSFTKLGKLSFGYGGKVVVDIVLAVSQASFVCGMIVFICQNSNHIMTPYVGDVGVVPYGIMSLIIITPLTWVRKV
jgi:proton-coupled amino acid transporter